MKEKEEMDETARQGARRELHRNQAHTNNVSRIRWAQSWKRHTPAKRFAEKVRKRRAGGGCAGEIVWG